MPAQWTLENDSARRRLNKKADWISHNTGSHEMPTLTLEELDDYQRRIVQ